MRSVFTILGILIVSTIFAQSKKELLEVTRKLEEAYRKDQEPRLLEDSLSKQLGYDAKEVKELWETINKNDSLNTIVVTEILDKYGWLSEQQTSKSATDALFFVIQHAALPVQLKYLPLLQKAVKEGKAKPSRYAYLLDRTNMRQGKLQVYGSQLTMSGNGGQYFFPIQDEPGVNIRREKIGLPPLETYAKQIGFTYVVPKEDLLKDKFVLVGFVMEQDQKPIPDVQLLVSGSVVATSDQYGIYKAIIPKALKEQNVLYKKQGYAVSELPIGGKDKEVSELFVILTRQ